MHILRFQLGWPASRELRLGRSRPSLLMERPGLEKADLAARDAKPEPVRWV
ncbi:Transcription termination factor Rho [Altererythrobacter epoxidivorans]|uniref:Transcription termination factor Rho n=1 Tax=Altererythrobacter epoxidivorans TaxID=361183 RepID=A0A0M4MJ10_9SPHN|nr:Transcription termination factor Rho [Altererythrobacter epoxidivorans]